MLNIILCDDNSKHNQHMTQRIERIITQAKIDVKVVFSSEDPMEIAGYSDLHKHDSNVYILDIDFQGSVNGIDLARHIRQNEPAAYIIFISAHQEYSMLCYKVKTFDFLVKPVQAATLRECLTSLDNDHKSLNSPSAPTLPVKSGAIVHFINISDLLYCEKLGNIAIFHTNKGTLKSYDSLESIQEKTTQYGFYRCHKSYLINLEHIAHINIEKNLVCMKNGDYCPVSRNYKRGLLEYAVGRL